MVAKLNFAKFLIPDTSKPAGLKNPNQGGEIVKQLSIGIDESSTKHAAYLMKPDGDRFSIFPMQNDRNGAKMISMKIVSALTKLGLYNVVTGMEATSVYGDNLVYALRKDGNLGRFHRKIHVLNSNQVENFKKSYPELPKNDPVDAFVFADQFRFGRIDKEVYMDDYRYKAL